MRKNFLKEKIAAHIINLVPWKYEIQEVKSK